MSVAVEPLLTVPEVAQRLRVSEVTVRRWLRGGRLRGVQPAGAGGNHRIPESELRRIGAVPSDPDATPPAGSRP